MSAPHRPPFSLEDIVVGRNPRMRAIFRYLALVGPGQGTMLVTGESGTGKEVVAHALHLHSARRDKTFVAVNCGQFPGTLIESALFGHERGAFPGAGPSRAGRFERADGGTLFLDDVDEIPPSLQVKLLRVLQQRTIDRIGGARPVPIDVRVVVGTRRDLQGLVQEGRFREDLYYRLNVLSVHLPPLRERREDIPLLIAHFIERSCRRRGVPSGSLSTGVMQALVAHDWPGNVRELENTCERLADPDPPRAGWSAEDDDAWDILAGGPLDAPAAPDAAASGSGLTAAPRGSGAAVPSPGNLAGLSLDEYLRRVEAECIASALAATRGNKSRAARMLGIKRSTLGDRIHRCGVDA